MIFVYEKYTRFMGICKFSWYRIRIRIIGGTLHTWKSFYVEEGELDFLMFEWHKW